MKKKKAEDAKLQITAEMLEARASSKWRKLACSKPQTLAQASNADGSGNAYGAACSHDVNPSSPSR